MLQALSADSNVDALLELCRAFRPDVRRDRR